MADVVQTAPIGFSDAVELINDVPQDVFAEICQNVMSFLQTKISHVDTEEIQKKLDQTETSISKDNLHSIINAIAHIYRFSAKNKLSVEDLTVHLKSNQHIRDQAIAALKHVWKDHGSKLIKVTENKPTFSSGQLVDMKWKLGLAMSSDTCKNLNSPYVVLSLKIADSSGNITVKSLELTVPEFQNLSKEFKKMGKIMETV